MFAKRGTKTDIPCFRCLALKADLSSYSFATPRTLHFTRVMIEKVKAGDKEIQGDLKSKYMLSIEPDLSDFPLVGFHPSVDIYSIFR